MRIFLVFLSAALAGAALLALPGCGGSVVDAPQNGTWKVVLLHPGEETALFLVEVVQKTTGTKASFVSAGQKVFEGAKTAATRDDGGPLRLTATTDDGSMAFVVYPPEGEAHPKEMLGYGDRPGERQFVRFERSAETKLDPKQSTTSHPAAADFKRATRKQDDKERAAALRPIVDEHPSDVLGYYAGLELLAALAAEGASEANLRERADRAVAFAAAHGPEMKAKALLVVARILVAVGKPSALAVEYARKAEEALGDAAPAGGRVPVVKTLTAALRKADRTDEAREAAARLEGLEQELDREFLKEAVPFETESVRRRGDKGDRVVLVELFTSAHCGPCPPADIAFDALLKSRRGGDVVLLQYHVNTAGLDALNNEESDWRSKFYRSPGSPSFYVNGRPGPETGGPRELGKEAYGDLMEAIQRPLTTTAAAKLTLGVTRAGDKIDVRAEVSGLEKPGEHVRLRLALIEDVVRYPGRNGQRLHSHVVRAFPGGVEGMSLPNGTAVREASVSLAGVRKSLGEYLDGLRVPEEGRPIALDRLKVVGFVQDDRTKEVLQAAETDVPER